jgi:hypothetical protein
MCHTRSEEGFWLGFGCKVLRNIGGKKLIMHGAGKEHKNLEGLTVIHTPLPSSLSLFPFSLSH